MTEVVGVREREIVNFDKFRQGWIRLDPGRHNTDIEVQETFETSREVTEKLKDVDCSMMKDLKDTNAKFGLMPRRIYNSNGTNREYTIFIYWYTDPADGQRKRIAHEFDTARELAGIIGLRRGLSVSDDPPETTEALGKLQELIDSQPLYVTKPPSRPSQTRH